MVTNATPGEFSPLPTTREERGRQIAKLGGIRPLGAGYHRRSNVETAMHMIKSKFGAAVRSKLPVAQVNEVLAKLVCHNLACIVRAVHEFGIDVDLTPVQP